MRLILVVLALSLGSPVQANPKIELDSAWIAVQAEGSVPSDKEVRVVLGTDVTLFLVVEARVDGKKRWFTDAPRLRKRGRRIRGRWIQAWPDDYPPIHIQWKTVEPSLSLGIYDNTGTFGTEPHAPKHPTHPSRWHWCPITYKEHSLTLGSGWTHPANARPHESPDRYSGLGTMRYGASIRMGEQRVNTPGRDNRTRAGIHESVATVRFRKDNSFVGYMTELMNVPYVYGSASPSGKDRDHQSEKATGADCADLIVYGWRRGGKRLKYTWSQGLKSYTKKMKNVSYMTDGSYRTEGGNLIEFGDAIRAGDILLWGRHVAIVVEKDPKNVLTKDTKILHTVWGSPEIVPLRKIGYGFDKTDFEIRRLK